MRAEIDIAKGMDLPAEAAPHRRALRLATDDLLAAVDQGDMQGIAANAPGAVLAAAGAILAAGGQDAGVQHLQAALHMLIEHTRDRIDRHLMLRTGPDDVAAAAVALHLAVLGICAALGIPYEAARDEIVAAEREQRPAALGPLLGT